MVDEHVVDDFCNIEQQRDWPEIAGLYLTYINFCYFLSLLKGRNLVSEVSDENIAGIELNDDVKGEPIIVPEITASMFKTYVQSYK